MIFSDTPPPPITFEEKSNDDEMMYVSQFYGFNISFNPKSDQHVTSLY